jgi:hypothetical protein
MMTDQAKLKLAAGALRSINSILAVYPAEEDVVVQSDVIAALRRIVNECLADMGDMQTTTGR